ncbi:hypothetical protein DFH08DRAFT_917223 [Mycena albidolilacea]|uniref:DUF6570 domain-containing protein n=1 Tax=Mycena albidolilacea TaxID=1033008 RepID=A0AAD6ZHA7_9AGAR|nr:hypothetical protein DFH08DRAFT_917223 [Mycena albidolilacea]
MVLQRERFSLDNPIEESSGPILARGCDQVRTECESKLGIGTKPPNSLANNLRIGELPWQLKDLTWAEKMMIAKVRHNRCVVRVASGRGKLVANAIMFATPIRKVYDTLPLSQDELSEVLVFVFLGSAKPTDEDFVRTPMFVRRQRVKDALDWLKLNHRDYSCLEISQSNLEALPEAGIPCGVEWKQTEAEESNLIPEAMSLDNNGDDLPENSMFWMTYKH